MTNLIKLNYRKIVGFLFAVFLLSVNRPHKKLKNISESFNIVPLYSHRISKSSFEKIVKWFLKNKYEFISTSQLIDILHKRENIKNKVWFSLDDGWKNNLDLLPIIEKYKIPITIFLSTGCIQDGYFWFSLVCKYKHLLNFKHPHDLWNIPENEREVEVLNLLKKIKYDDFCGETLAPNDIIELSKSKFIEFGNHTHHHVLLANCLMENKIKEIKLSSNTIFKWVQKSPNSFAFPNGNCDISVYEILKEQKIIIAASTRHGYINTKDFEYYCLPRISLPENLSFSEIKCRILNIWLRNKNE